MGGSGTEIASKPFQHSKARIATNSSLVEPFIVAGGASLSRAGSLVYHRRHIRGMGSLAKLERESERDRERERLLGVAAVTQLRPHLICLKYTAPPAEVLMATRPHPLLRTTLSFFFPLPRHRVAFLSFYPLFLYPFPCIRTIPSRTATDGTGFRIIITVNFYQSITIYG